MFQCVISILNIFRSFHHALQASAELVHENKSQFQNPFSFITRNHYTYYTQLKKTDK